jgi:hypothetical protein
MSAAYLIAAVTTDRKPSGEYSSGEIVPSGEVHDRLYGILAGHGRITPGLINGQMVEEAETATWYVDPVARPADAALRLPHPLRRVPGTGRLGSRR